MCEPLLVQHDELLRDLRDLGPHACFGLRPVGTVETIQRRLIAAREVPDRVDLIRRDVELVVAAVLEQEVVALHTRDRSLHHAGEPGDAVLMMHDVVAGVEVVEEPFGVAVPSRPNGAVRTPAPREIGLREDGELDGRKDEAALERRHGDLEAKPVLVEEAVDARLGAVAVGAHDDSVALTAQVGQLRHEAVAAADHGVPTDRLDGGHVRSFRCDRDRPRRCVRVHEQPVEREMQAREPVGAVCAPGLGQRAGEVRLLRHDVGGAVAQSLRLDQHDLRVGGNEVEQHVLRVDQPRQPRLHAVEGQTVGETLPLLAPHGCSETRRPARARTSSLGSSSRHGKIRTSVRSFVDR